MYITELLLSIDYFPFVHIIYEYVNDYVHILTKRNIICKYKYDTDGDRDTHIREVMNCEKKNQIEDEMMQRK